MTHDLFGKLKYKDGHESWSGSARLPRFAAVGQLPDPPEMTEEEAERVATEMKAAVENMRQLLRERFGEEAEAAFAAVDRSIDEQEHATDDPELPDPEVEEHERRRAERRQKNAALFAKGRFPIRIAGPGREEPTPAQEAAFRFLLGNEAAVFEAVAGQVWESFQSVYEQEQLRALMMLRPAANAADLTGRFAVTRLDIAREARGGFAHLVFQVECEWQDEDGLLIVYSPDTRSAAWTAWEGLSDVLESDEPEEPGPEFVPTPHDELLEAILTDDGAKARELIAAGADINALGPDEYPPLWIAVDQMEPEEVRRLLAFGADPGLVNPDENSTPLKHARKMYREMGFSPAKTRDVAMDGFLSLIQAAVGGQVGDIKTRVETIIQLLEAAGAK
ncbi:DUF6985 domain-containing protein [Frigoriglobus tundricola]|uniref:DUF6985 domain-containing protein n=1 Tax=Frigoriglobus tundricola TaxID=2774151 RepID=A0A6M5YSG3_9BACT|nr:hypothetical protein [Frigoriglobus tundricola]QJW96938.1 hypothetical protein FTUN_4498 [Frigoriglobus tundricola]